MPNRDYTKEIDQHADQRMVPLPIAMAIIAVVIGGTCFGIIAAKPAEEPRHAQKVTPVMASPPVAVADK